MPILNPRVELLCTGTELLEHKTNTNSNLIAAELASVGLGLSRITTVGDDPRDIEESLRRALRSAPFVLTCGGLGPTFDDLTRECASRVTRRRLQFSKLILADIRRRFRSFGLAMPRDNRRQAYLLEGAIPIENRNGTAPGQILSLPGGRALILLPGPPGELLPMVREAVLPFLKGVLPRMERRRLLLRTIGSPESQVDAEIRPLLRSHRPPPGVRIRFGILAHLSVIDVEAWLEGKDPVSLEREREILKEKFSRRLGKRVFGEGSASLEESVGRLLRARGETLSTAESCTGGRIADKITNVPGSSDYFLESCVAYSNESKRRLLGVRGSTLKRSGAVSAAVAREMALGSRRRSGSAWSLSVTGIAGPGGGTGSKPVGLVYFGIASKRRVWTESKLFAGSREEVKERAALAALNFLRLKLL